MIKKEPTRFQESDWVIETELGAGGYSKYIYLHVLSLPNLTF